MPPKKKTYKCKICGKKYKGFRVSNTCSYNCSGKSMMKTIKGLQNKRSKVYKEWEKDWEAGIKKYLNLKK